MAILLATLALLVVACTINNDWQASRPIVVISRNKSSGTRKGLEEMLYGKQEVVLPKGDHYVEAAGEAAVVASVRSDQQAIGYEGLGFLRVNPNGIKSLSLDGVAPTPENIANGSYEMSRPLNVVHRDDKLASNSAAAEFLKYMLSTDGQKVVSDNGYTTNSELEDVVYTPESGLTGEVAIVGSTTVEPLMQRLAETFKAIVSGVDIRISAAGSNASVTGMKDGDADFGMYSAEVSDSVLEEMMSGSGEYTVDVSTLAQDAIVFVVHPSNTTNNIRKDQLRHLYNITDITFGNWQQMLDHTPEEIK